MGADRDKTGQFTPEHTDAEILAAVRAHEPAATSEVSDELGLTRQGADRRLRRLRDEGRVSSKKIAASLVWFAPEQADEERRETGRDAARSDPGNESGEDTDSIEGDARAESDEALRSTVRDALAGSGDLLERRVDEILKMYAYLREHGTGEKSDLLDTVDVDATGYAGRGSVWSNMVKGRDTLRALPGVRKPSDGRSTWEYDPDVGRGDA